MCAIAYVIMKIDSCVVLFGLFACCYYSKLARDFAIVIVFLLLLLVLLDVVLCIALRTVQYIAQRCQRLNLLYTICFRNRNRFAKSFLVVVVVVVVVVLCDFSCKF